MFILYTLQAASHGEQYTVALNSDQLCLLALGANLPHAGRTPSETLRVALDDLAARGCLITAVSRFFRTPAFPAGHGPDYINTAACLHHGGSPDTLLALLHDVEATHGRARAERWGQRTLDLDLLAVGNFVLPDHATWNHWHELPPESQTRIAPDRLILPHPRLQDRAFVLIPLADVAPDWVHPVLGQSVADMCAALPPKTVAEIVPVAPPPGPST